MPLFTEQELKTTTTCRCLDTFNLFKTLDVGKVQQTLTPTATDIPVIEVDNIRYYQMEALCNVFGLTSDLIVVPEEGMFKVTFSDKDEVADLSVTHIYLNRLGVQAIVMNYLDNLKLISLKDKTEINPMEPDDNANETYADYNYGGYPDTKFSR